MSSDELPEVVGGRYHRRAFIGAGAMGSVWRMWDERLRRPVAVKVLRPEAVSEAALARFTEEAHVAAQLQHPGILPVHDLGVLDDGRTWFAMKEVRGRTLEELLLQAHAAWRIGDPPPGGWTFRRILEGFRRACETVAYAHARGVVHRDLKPANLMFGEFGEVLVLDWGLSHLAEDDAVELPQGHARETVVGHLVGTPAYMAPEQARGDRDAVGSATDVYGLGATLYEVLCERPPRVAAELDELIEAIGSGGPFQPPSRWAEAFPVDEALDAIVLRALRADPTERYPDASGLAADLAEWLDGALKRQRALDLVERADALLDESRVLRDGAFQARRDAGEALKGVPQNAPVADKLAGWALADRAETDEWAADDREAVAVQTLRNALSHADLAEAHDRLAAIHHRRHAELETVGRAKAAAREALALAEHDRSGAFATYLRGWGAVTVVTDVPGAEVRLHRLVLEERRLVPRFARVLGRTPLIAAPLPRGSHLLTLHLDGHREVRLPVWITRGHHADFVAPDETEPSPIWLPPQGELADDDCYVPQGWFWSGSDEFQHTRDPRRMWCHPFVIKRDPVTLGEYLAYLNALLEQDEALALAAEPTIGDVNEAYLERGPDGRFLGIRTDKMSDGWEHLVRTPDVPMGFLRWDQAMAYAAWKAERDGLGWRLPMELEWQRAGRGADRRTYPWGENFDPTWCRMVQTATHPIIVPVDAHPADISVFGVRGLAGNTSDWALDPVPALPNQATSDRVLVGTRRSAMRWLLGGNCGVGPKTCALTQRSRLTEEFRSIRTTCRLVRAHGVETTDPRPALMDSGATPEEQS